MYFSTIFLSYFYKNNQNFLKTTLKFSLILDYLKYIEIFIFINLITNREPKLYYFCFVGSIILMLIIDPKTTI